MDAIVKQKIDKYVNNAFTAAQLKANEAAQIETANARAKMAKMGLAASSSMDHEMIRIQCEKINSLLKVRGDALLDAYEIYGVPFDEAAILRDVGHIRSTLIAAISGSARSQDTMRAVRTGRGTSGLEIRSGNFQRQLNKLTQTAGRELSCQIEQRRVTPKMKRPQATVNITYHLQDNARVNINSSDQSANSVTVTQQQLFADIRDRVTQQIAGEDQAVVLAKLNELEQAQGTQTFSEKFTAFLAVTADYMTILGPFMPALAELARKSLGL
jgi:hypothetical protein